MDEIIISQSTSPLDRIGYGSCGSVWADSSRFPDIDKCTTTSTVVLKRADGLPDRSIENEAKMHKHILSSIGPFSINFSIPKHVAFLEPGSSEWTNILPRLPADARPCQALISERILPMPRRIRRLMVQEFWNGPANMIDAVIDDKRNEHCLIRPYLGRRRMDSNTSGRKSMLKSISLRNYPLYIDQMEALGLPAHKYARAMADGLAFLLWVAEIDACDVEFVLARPRPRPLSGHDDDGTCTPDTFTSDNLTSDTFTSGPLGVHSLWILDFDCCKKLPMTSEGVKIAAERFWRNDPFYPNPNAKCQQDAALWDGFKHRFLKTSAEIMASKGSDERTRELPGQLIARIVDTVGVYSKGVPTGLE